MEAWQREVLDCMKREKRPVVTIRSIDVPSDARTLMLGWNVSLSERSTTRHVYKEGSTLHLVDYNSSINGRPECVNHLYGPELACELIVPTKRAYSESTDYAFAHAMASRGFPLTFTTHDPEMHHRRLNRTWCDGYAGYRREELV